MRRLLLIALVWAFSPAMVVAEDHKSGEIAGDRAAEATNYRLHAVISPDGTITYYRVPMKLGLGTPEERGKHGAKTPTGAKAPTPALAFGSVKIGQIYELMNPEGDFAGYITLAAGKSKVPAFASGWRAKPLQVEAIVEPYESVKAVRIGRKEALTQLRNGLERDVVELACNSWIRPDDFSVSVNLSASFKVLAEGQGGISFQATWKTATLCAGSS